MNTGIESVNRGPADYFNFGVVFYGLILGVAGVVTVGTGVAILGVVLMVFGLIYFLLQSSED